MSVPSTSGVTYTKVDQSYFEKRGLRHYAGVWSLYVANCERQLQSDGAQGTPASSLSIQY